MNDDKMRFATEKGFVVYEKCGIIEIEKVPSFGEVTLFYSEWEIYSSSQKRN